MRTVLAIALVALSWQRIQSQEMAEPAGPRAAVPALQAAIPVLPDRLVPINQGQVVGAAPALNFGNLVPAKIDLNDGRQQIVMMLESFRTEIQEVPVKFIRKEPRKRLVNQPDGTVYEQEFTVVMVDTEIQSVDVRVSVGVKPTVFPLDDFQFLNLDAQPVSNEDAANILATLRPVFLFDQFAGELQPISTNAKQVLKPDVLIVITKKAIRAGVANSLMMNVTPKIIIPDEEEVR